MGLDLEDLLYLFIQPGIGRERNVVIDEYLPLLLFVLSIEPHEYVIHFIEMVEY